MNNDLLAIHAKSFHWASFFLSKKTYKKCSALYNFCRTLDDIADDSSDLEIKKEQFLEIDKDEQFKKAVNFEKNRQLTKYSTLHYKRVYNKAVINEF